jgi:hypothetical protein
MKASFDDIRALTPLVPKWFDFNGTPRYCEFRPFESPNIYAREIALLEIACQSCGEVFLVEQHRDDLGKAYRRACGAKDIDLADSVREGTITYRDPPHHGCSGDSMLSITLRVVEFWRRGSQIEWARVPELEVAFPQEVET